jgi:hypothetical protein
MRKFSNKVSMLIFITIFMLGLQAVQATDLNSKAFSKNLIKALKSGNPGLQQSAMQMVIRYGSLLDVKEAEFDVMRIFRSDKSQGTRLLALMALIDMDSKWAVGFLRTQVEFEKDPMIKKQLTLLTSDSYQKKAAEADMTAAMKDFATLQKQIEVISLEEAVYTFQNDSKGNPLDGAKNQHMIHFKKDELPPVESFWSITMYDKETQFQIANPLNRYLINEPMIPELKLDKDGALTIYLQSDSPGAEKESNWLPAPKGEFYLVMRLYWPQRDVLEGIWKAPQVEKAK